MVSWAELLLLLVVVLTGIVLFGGVMAFVIWKVSRSGRRDTGGKPPGHGGPRPSRVVTPSPDSSDRPGEGTPGVCPRCSASVTPDAPQGLCPACLIAVGLGTQTSPESTPPSPLEPAELNRLFPNLEILDLIGHGGMGVVYKARQKNLDRLVALKILPRETARDPAFAERFHREARTLARLNHPGIVAVYEFGEVDGCFFLIMEYVDGADLRRVLQERRLTPAEALRIVPVVCDALQYAHANGVVHRDIKPGNILLDRAGGVKIADFGIAKLLGTEAVDVTLTGSQHSMGTLHYMAPEQVENPQAVDHRADIYSLGVVFYEMLTGELPLGRFAPPSRKVELDVRLDEVVLRTLEKEPARRYQQAGEVKTEVERIQGGFSNPGTSEGPRLVPPAADGNGRRTWKMAGSFAWMGLFAFFLIVWWIWARRPGLPSQAGVLLTLFVTGVVLTALLGACAPFGSTLLGLLALHDIRRCKVPPHRVKTALSATAAFPVLTLAAVFLVTTTALLASILRVSPTQFAPVFITVLLLTLGTVAALIFWRGSTWFRWARHLFAETPRETAPAAHGRTRFWVSMALLVPQFLLTVWLMGLFLGTAVSRPSGGPADLLQQNVPTALYFNSLEGMGVWEMREDVPHLKQESLPEFSPALDQLNDALRNVYERYLVTLREHASISTNAAGHTVIRLTPFERQLDSLESDFWLAADDALDPVQQAELRIRLPLRSPDATEIEHQNLPLMGTLGTSQSPILPRPSYVFRFGNGPVSLEYWMRGRWYVWRLKEGETIEPLLEDIPAKSAPEMPEDLRVLIDAASKEGGKMR